MDEIDFAADDFADILAKDDRYEARAYALLADVLGYLSEEAQKNGGNGHFGAADILDEFKERALDQYGPLTYTVLTEWGVRSCEDVGQMMFNLAASHRIGADEDDSQDAFAGGYDFREAFLDPYAT